MDAVMSRSVMQRMIGAAMLDSRTFDEVKRDDAATLQAVVVVAIVAVAQAIGAASKGGPGVVGGLVPAFAGLILWVEVASLIGNRLFGGKAIRGELLRTLGFAQTPSLLGILAMVPGMAVSVDTIVGLWLLMTGIAAIRQVFGFGVWKSAAIAVGGWIIAHIPIVIIHDLLG